MQSQLRMGPDPNPRKPKHTLPHGSTDCHCHVFGDQDKYPLAAARDFTPTPQPLSEYIRMRDTAGFERTVLVNASVYGFDNSVTLDAISKLGLHCARGVAGIHPDINTQELDRLYAGGMRGARLSTIVTGYGGTDLLDAIARKIGPLGWHVLLHVRNSEIFDIESQLMRAAAPIVFDSMGGVRGNDGVHAPGFQALLRILKGRDDCWVKLSSFYHASGSGPPEYADMKPMVDALVATRPDRVLFGTNWPHPAAYLRGWVPNDGDLIDVISGWLPDGNLRERIFVKNPAELFGFPDV